MLLTISTDHSPATDLGYLLHKHPDRFQTFKLSFGDCHVFYPEANENRCTVSLLLDVDPVEMARGKKRKQNFALAGYVNDRPYVASSFMSTAISQVFGSALSGRCKDKPDLVATPLPLDVSIEVLPVRGGEPMIRSMFEPLGYSVTVNRQTLDEQFPEWGDSHYFTVQLSQHLPLSELLNHLYVLIPVFDNQKHYFVGRDELQKLLDKGKGWLESHPEKETIVRRYLKFQSSLFRQALQQLTERVESESESDDNTRPNSKEPLEIELEKRFNLHDQRLDQVCEQLLKSGATRVIDLGCGEGKLLRRLIKQWQFKEIVGTDVAIKSLEIANKRLRLDELPSFQSERVKLLHGSLMYRDSRFDDFEAAAIVEVIEHLDPPRLSAFERVVFRHARPTTVIITTPNSEYNVMWPTLPAGQFRHGDHRFEWTREEFRTWADSICDRFGYSVECVPVGPLDKKVGAPTQMGIFRILSPVALAARTKASEEPNPSKPDLDLELDFVEKAASDSDARSNLDEQSHCSSDSGEKAADQ
jgi:3' terminal RNA ribose 2'-O-methyltransferase Hen1